MRERESLLMRIGSLLEDYRELEALLGQEVTPGLPVVDIREPDGIVRAKQAAAKVRDVFRLAGDEPIHDICGLLEDRGIKVLRIPVQSDGFFGLSVAGGRSGPAVVVNVWDRISVER